MENLRGTKTTFSPVKQRPVLGKQWPCWDQRELGPDGGQKLSPSWIRMTTCSPPFTKVPFGAHLASLLVFPPHTIELQQPHCSPTAGCVLSHSRPLVKFSLSLTGLLPPFLSNALTQALALQLKSCLLSALCDPRTPRSIVPCLPQPGSCFQLQL